MITQNSKSLRDGASRYADDAMGATSQALEQSRLYANQAFDKAGEKVRELREGMKDVASRSVSSVSEATAAAQRQLGQYAQATGRYVTEQPVKSALIAAAVGAAVAALVLALRRERDRY
jgi:ElaB/YqjD/DUF883 family membrane-anchored ribosome-binding protein